MISFWRQGEIPSTTTGELQRNGKAATFQQRHALNPSVALRTGDPSRLLRTDCGKSISSIRLNVEFIHFYSREWAQSSSIQSCTCMPPLVSSYLVLQVVNALRSRARIEANLGLLVTKSDNSLVDHMSFPDPRHSFRQTGLTAVVRGVIPHSRPHISKWQFW